ncbi:dipeptide ABC transporter ATP-binding protein [Aquibacillus sp. 3ASR75-11]|uniref:Dipeptide ABC transporter ATP-binding protein n=1 Tax=Terrihalobacillus insolitus TaxID=2950438 RepID=A0A9X3WN00_9BACI|nr:dipeptide ABC transporter ATP-binding protein [Terrihalobacillus insolitus]MDC3412280.1 dipeptide ABC transporter ATP-binding protein [Terrihalobacillus insolitus]MDC3423027.1 dipeptide ABC transporter ATP-binding protein [Terrihalobacillus insolitus]
MSTLLEVKDLKKHFPVKGDSLFTKEMKTVKAVDGVSFTVNKGETLGLVGESGCGKSTTGRTILKLVEPTSGEIYFRGENITSFQGEKMRKLRKEMQIIFQDPYASLNPRKTIEQIITEPMKIFNIPKRDRNKKLNRLLDVVGLSSYHKVRYPHEFSGGQRQRIGIARALALEPELVICDEPVSALDVSIQAQVVNLMEDLQEEFNLTYIFIAHDLSVVHHISDRVAVMYLGQIVETGQVDELYKNPKHPYTQALLSAIPEADPTIQKERIVVKGDLPSPSNPPQGCKFHTRCPYAEEICRTVNPALKQVSTGGQQAACHFVKEVVEEY